MNDDHNVAGEYPPGAHLRILGDYFNNLTMLCHQQSKAAGWWNDLFTGLSLIPGDDLHNDPTINEMRRSAYPYVVATKIALIHSEISEALEGYRSGKMDDKLPERAQIEVELADAVIRIGDLADQLGLDVGGAIAEKLNYNQTRLDHAKESRMKPGGKVF